MIEIMARGSEITRPNPSPSVVVLSGPNGAGKSTAAPRLLHESLQITEFVNADVIARGLSGFAPERAAVRAGRIMLERLNELACEQVSFAFETTLAGRAFAPWLETLLSQGYSMRLFYLWVSSPEFAIARVSERVRKGGHSIPAETIRRRYFAGLRNLFELYIPLAADWQVVDNTITNAPTTVAEGRRLSSAVVLDPERWKLIHDLAATTP